MTSADAPAGSAHGAPPGAAPALTPADQSTLFGLARDAVSARLAAKARPPLYSVPPALNARCGLFVSFHRGRALRGCVGSLLARKPLHELVCDLAVAAAFEDPRFPPVTAPELPHLSMEISLLTPPAPMLPDEVVPGEHGLCVIRGEQRGVLLPQVATEFGWNRESLLANVCRKAGLDDDAWREPETTLLGFRAEVFRHRPW